MTDREANHRHPYAERAGEAFWNTAVAGRSPGDVGPWYRRKFDTSGMKIATAGSCFAQHIGRALRRAGRPAIDLEPPPRGLAPENWARFGYGVYSARYGNVYTSRQLLQLLQRATGEFVPVTSTWTHGDGFVDPFRPRIEPESFSTIDELEICRRHHLERVAAVFETADLFVFTLGLTELWCGAADGAALPLAPGVAGGQYDPSDYRFVNLTCDEVVADLEQLLARVRAINPRLHFILTVSPVPLAATATGEHVAVAASYSKAVLRAACGELIARHDHVDYFPAYEIVTSPATGAAFFEADRRRVTAEGVDHVMAQFFAAHEISPAEVEEDATAGEPFAPECEDELLVAAGRMR